MRFVVDIGDLIQLGIIIIVLLAFGLVYLSLKIKDWLDNKKWEDNRKIAIRIIDEFEVLLSKYEIKLPNKDRQNNEEESCIYGEAYYDLEDKIIEILNNCKL